MANQIKMALVQSIITLHPHGWSRRRIARELGIHRETVGRYVDRSESRLATNAPTGSTGSRQAGPDDSKPASNAPLGSGAAKPLSNAPTGSPSAAAGWRSIIIDKLDQGLSAQRIYQDLIGDHGLHRQLLQRPPTDQEALGRHAGTGRRAREGFVTGLCISCGKIHLTLRPS